MASPYFSIIDIDFDPLVARIVGGPIIATFLDWDSDCSQFGRIVYCLDFLDVLPLGAVLEIAEEINEMLARLKFSEEESQ